MKFPSFEFMFYAIAVFSLLMALLLHVWVEWIYPPIVKRRVKKIEKHEAASFTEYRTSFMGYLGTLGPLMMFGSVLYVSNKSTSLEARDDLGYFIITALLSVGVIWFTFKLVYILPRRYFIWENSVIYYHTGLREVVIDEIKDISAGHIYKSNYYSVEIWNEKKPWVYIDILALAHPEEIYSILKVKSKTTHEFYY